MNISDNLRRPLNEKSWAISQSNLELDILYSSEVLRDIRPKLTTLMLTLLKSLV